VFQHRILSFDVPVTDVVTGGWDMLSLLTRNLS